MYQKVVLVGNLGRDPEMRYTSDGTPVTSFSIATNETWTDRDGQQQQRTTSWRISAWPISPGYFSHNKVLLSMSESRKVIMPVGKLDISSPPGQELNRVYRTVKDNYKR